MYCKSPYFSTPTVKKADTVPIKIFISPLRCIKFRESGDGVSQYFQFLGLFQTSFWWLAKDFDPAVMLGFFMDGDGSAMQKSAILEYIYFANATPRVPNLFLLLTADGLIVFPVRDCQADQVEKRSVCLIET